MLGFSLVKQQELLELLITECQDEMNTMKSVEIKLQPTKS